MNKGKSIGLLVVSVLVAVLLLVGVVLAADVTVDNFNDGSWPEQANATICNTVFTEDEAHGACIGDSICTHCFPLTSTYNASSSNDVLGLERDFNVTRTLGTGAVKATIDEDELGVLNFSIEQSSEGITEVVWDGDDNDGATIDQDGLGGVDITDNGTNGGFLVTIAFADVRTALDFEVYSNTRVATYQIALPGDIDDVSNRVDLFVPFSSFSGDTSVFTSAGAILLRIDGTVDPGLDFTVDLFEATTVREYGDLPTSTYGASILNAYHIPQTLRLGNNVDAESVVNESADAKGDNNDDFDDEDGVVPTGQWSSGTDGGTLRVFREGCADIAGGCYINGWIDWNGDGDFGDTLEHVIQNVNRTTDAYEDHTFDVPTGFGGQYYYARFRICETSTACNDPGITDTGVLNGEIEDYRWYWGPTAITLTDITARSTPTTVIFIAAGLLGLGVLAVLVLARRRHRSL